MIRRSLLLCALPLLVPAHGIPGGEPRAAAPHAASSRVRQAPAGLQDEHQEQPFVRCTRCKNLGREECGEHRSLDLELEPTVEYCSFVADCEECLGAGWLDCEHCENPAVEERLEAKRARVAALREEMAAIDAVMERPLRKVVVPHLLTVCEVDSWKVGKQRLKDHDLAHLYAQRGSAAIEDYKQVLGVPAEQFAERLLLLMWGWQQDHEQGSLRFMEISGEQGAKLLGVHPTYSVPVRSEYFREDEALHRNVVHNLTHLLLSHQDPAMWLGNIKGGWADAGVAHWFEWRLHGICDNYCYQEVDTSSGRGFEGGDFKVGLRKALGKDELPTVATVMQQNTDSMTPVMNALSFAIVDYLMALDPEQANALFTKMRARTETRDALKEAFGISTLQLQERVRAWIEAEYPTR